MDKRMNSEERKLSILSAVRGLFCEKGLNVTSKELSEAAGVSEALIYKYFSNKEEIYVSLLDHCCKGHEELGNQLAEQQPSSEVLACATYLMIHAMTTGLSHPEDQFHLNSNQVSGLVMQSLISDGEIARQLFNLGLGPWVEFFVMSLEAAEQAGDLSRSPIPFETLVWMVHHAILGNKLTLKPDPDAFIAPIKNHGEFRHWLLVFCLQSFGLKAPKIEEILESDFFKQFKNKTILTQGETQ